MFWFGVVVGALVAGVLGGPLASRWSARLEARWDASAADAVASRPGVAAQVAALGDDEPLFTAYQRQYWSWALLVGGGIVAIAVVGALTTWALGGGAGRVVAGVTAAVVGGATMFWVRKLVAKRRIIRLVYRRRAG